MRIYTKKGDQGQTTLLRGERVQKDHPRVSACGHVDELNATIGVAVAVEPVDFHQDLFQDIQADLFSIGSMLAIADSDAMNKLSEKVSLGEARIRALETEIDTATDAMLPLDAFVLPGGCLKSAMLHHARTVCRRAERSLVSLSQREAVPALVLPYMNRLSDLLFTFARLANMRAGIADRKW